MSEAGVESTNGEQRSVNVDVWTLIKDVWSITKSPARPTPEDMGFCLEAMRHFMRAGNAPRILSLGVTPEFYHLPWPEHTDYLAVDRNPDMIEAIWLGPREQVLCANWLSMDLPQSSRDIVYSDAGLIWLAYPHEHRMLAEKLKYIMAEGGILLLRLISPPENRQPLNKIINDARNGLIGNLNVLMLRLLSNMQENSQKGAEWNRLCQLVNDIAPDIDELCCRLYSIPGPHFRTVPLVSKQHYVSVPEVIDTFCQLVGGFEVLEIKYPTYEMGENCPTLILERRSKR